MCADMSDMAVYYTLHSPTHGQIFTAFSLVARREAHSELKPTGGDGKGKYGLLKQTGG